MDRATQIILALGILLLVGLAVETLARRIHLPRVTLLLLVGFFIGPPMLDMIPGVIIRNWFPINPYRLSHDWLSPSQQDDPLITEENRTLCY